MACEHLTYNEINAKTNATVMVIQPDVPKILELAPALVAHFHEHPQLAHYRNSAERQPYQFNDFFSARQFRQKGIYREFYRHVDTNEQMALLLSNRDDTTDIGIAINRKNKDFSECERAVLTALRPHLIQARVNALAFTAAAQRTGALADSLASLHAGVVLLQPDGRVAWFTPRALALLEQFFPGAGRHAAQLPELLADWWRRWQTPPANAPVETRRPFTKAIAGARLTVHGQTNADGSHRLLLTEEKDFSLADHARQTGLTPRETEVLRWLAEGKNNPEIAIILRLSPRTVHKHVERIFRKLGVETRHAATLEVLKWKKGWGGLRNSPATNAA